MIDIMIIYINQNDWYLTKCKKVLQSGPTSHAFRKFLLRFIQYGSQLSKKFRIDHEADAKIMHSFDNIFNLNNNLKFLLRMFCMKFYYVYVILYLAIHANIAIRVIELHCIRSLCILQPLEGDLLLYFMQPCFINLENGKTIENLEIFAEIKQYTNGIL